MRGQIIRIYLSTDEYNRILYYIAIKKEDLKEQYVCMQNYQLVHVESNIEK